MSLEKDGLWKLEDRDDGTDSWEWVTTLKPATSVPSVRFVCDSTEEASTRNTREKRGRGKEKNIVGGRKRARK